MCRFLARVRAPVPEAPAGHLIDFQRRSVCAPKKQKTPLHNQRVRPHVRHVMDIIYTIYIHFIGDRREDVRVPPPYIRMIRSDMHLTRMARIARLHMIWYRTTCHAPPPPRHGSLAAAFLSFPHQVVWPFTNYLLPDVLDMYDVELWTTHIHTPYYIPPETQIDHR